MNPNPDIPTITLRDEAGNTYAYDGASPLPTLTVTPTGGVRGVYACPTCGCEEGALHAPTCTAPRGAIGEFALLPEENTQRRAQLSLEINVDIGPPNESAQSPTGQIFQVRDDMGLTLDPMAFAKKSCSRCYGRGTINVIQPVSASFFVDNPTALPFRVVQGKGQALRQAKTCICALKRREVVERQVAAGRLRVGLPLSQARRKLYGLK